jgi:crossover junction endodeoxyribonuclease RuvC
MIILGIDPAIAHIGWGVILSIGSSIKYLGSGVIDTDAQTTLPQRLAKISEEIENVIQNFRPDLVAMEEVFINKNALSSLKLSHARGAIMAVIGRSGLELHEFAPNKINLFLPIFLINCPKAKKYFARN